MCKWHEGAGRKVTERALQCKVLGFPKLHDKPSIAKQNAMLDSQWTILVGKRRLPLLSKTCPEAVTLTTA